MKRLTTKYVWCSNISTYFFSLSCFQCHDRVWLITVYRANNEVNLAQRQETNQRPVLGSRDLSRPIRGPHIRQDGQVTKNLDHWHEKIAQNRRRKLQRRRWKYKLFKIQGCNKLSVAVSWINNISKVPFLSFLAPTGAQGVTMRVRSSVWSVKLS